MKQIIKYIAVILCLVLSFSLFACDKKKSLDSSREDLTVVKRIGDIEVTLEMYRYVALNYKSSYEAGASSDIWLGDTGKALLDEVNSAIDQTLIQMYTVPAICEKYGIHPDDSYIVDTVELNMENTYESYENDYEAYLEYISAYNMNDAVYRFLVRNEILSEELIAKMISAGELPADNDAIFDILIGDDCVRVKQILIASDNGKTEEENRALADRILDELNGGADFDDLIAEYGEDLYMFNNDTGYYVTRGTFHKNFEDTAFELEMGEISGIVETDAGLSIIKKYEKDTAYIKDNIDSLAEDYIAGQFNIALEQFSNTLTVENTDAMEKYSIFNTGK